MKDVIKLLNVEAQKQLNHKDRKKDLLCQNHDLVSAVRGF